MKVNIENQETTTTLSLYIKQGQNICIIANKTSDLHRKYYKREIKRQQI